MYRQVGDLELDEKAIALKGLIVRHLILPNGLAGSEDSLSWLAREVSPSVTVSVMSQYFPTNRAPQIPELSRRITSSEYLDVVRLVERLGLGNGWLQGMGAADNYQPDFEREGHPFELPVDNPQ
jgi:putative pyruvate formate lyase activating enzyme